MAKIIYNEGRVVGLSAYEIYVQQFLETNPDGTPATEREWLSASIASGTSIVIDVPEGLTDIPLPESCNLCAANTIIGSLFMGKLDPTGSHIDDYGPLISNTDALSPSGEVININDQTVCPKGAHEVDEWIYSCRNLILEYARIVDGIIIQPGTWVNRNQPESDLPKMDFEPDLSKPPVIRLFKLRSHSTSVPIQLLLTGFTNRGVISAVAGLGGSTDTSSPQDGDFLGPAVFPWANKIVFLAPPTNPQLVNIPIMLTSSVPPFDSIPSGVDMSSTTLALSLHNNQDATPDGAFIISTNPLETLLHLPGTDPDTIYWAALLQALAQNKKIDILGPVLKALKTSIPLGEIDFGVESTALKLKVGVIDENPGNVTINTNHIQFPNGIRLYLSSTPPTGARNGDIGIGW